MIIDVLEFFHDFGSFIKDNIYIFALWTLICMTISFTITNKFNKRNNKKLVEENQRLQKENEYLRKIFDETDDENRLLAGKNLGDAISAKDISNRFKKK